jgi:hypothetical protein
MRKTVQANLCTVWIAALTVLHLWRWLGGNASQAPPGVGAGSNQATAVRAKNAASAKFVGTATRGGPLPRFVVLQCPENGRYLIPAAARSLLAAGTAEMPLSQLGFEVVVDHPGIAPGWVALRCVENGFFMEIVPPSEAAAWTVRCSSHAVTSQTLVKIEQVQKAAFLRFRDTAAHVNYIGRGDVRGHARPPREGLAAGKEPSARWFLRALPQEEVAASVAAWKLQLAQEEGAAARARRKILALPPSAEKRVISFGLYGAAAKYTHGMVQNCILAREYFPGWSVRVYIDQTVPRNVVAKLVQLGAEIKMIDHLKKGETVGMFWRFLVADDPKVDRYIVRDSDSRLNARDRFAVEEWIESRFAVHSIRDHPNHRRALNGGMWGGVKGAIPDMENKIYLYLSSAERTDYGADLRFLDKEIWPLIRGKTLSHDAYFCEQFPNARSFPTRRPSTFEHVGQVYFEDDTIRVSDVDIMRDSTAPVACRREPAYLYG